MPTPSDTGAPVTFVIPGQRLDGLATRDRSGSASATPAMGLTGKVKSAVRVGSTRGDGKVHRVTAVPGEDMVVLHVAHGPTLVLHPHTARDLMLAQTGAARPRTRSGSKAAAALPQEVTVPTQLSWPGLEGPAGQARGTSRGWVGQVLLSLVEVVSGPLREVAQEAAADQIVQRVDGQVDEGVYALQAETLTRLKGQPRLATLPAAPEGGPVLVLVHGTFSDTVGTFGKLWQQHPQRVQTLFRHYGGRVYALDHATLGRSPIDNAYTLAQVCPPGTRLHLLTHSRGGLVAEVLARAAGLQALDEAAEALFNVDALPDGMAAKLSAADRKKLQAALEGQKRTLAALIEHLKAQRISVERIVRAACPARGTLLASQRFDAYISVFKWALDLAQIPVLPELIDFIGGVAQRRTDPSQLPGVAAMVPDSPLVRWLHAAEAPVAGELRVLAGDLEGDSVGSWLKTLMADAYYWTDNDLVVQTRSMYGGVPRANGATFLLDQGGKVNHFSYFSNERTAEAVVVGLTQDRPGGWQPIGPLSYAGESATGTRGAPPARAAGSAAVASSLPAVFVLPGILGSHLKVDGQRIWLGWRLINGLKRLKYPDAAGHSVQPDGPVGLSYDALVEFLGQSHEVIEFAYDWRKPIEQEARRLAAAVQAALAARDKSGQPVRIVAHSMGGLVARTMQLECPEVWAQMMSRPGARLLMLGTPNAGSWAPMQVLSGDDTFGNALVAFGAPFQDHSARELMAQFPGFIQLQQSLLDDPRRLDRHETWVQLAADDLAQVEENAWWHDDTRQTTAYRWGVPAQPVLDAAVALRRRLDAQRDTLWSQFQNQVLLVVGRASFTPDGYEIGNEGLVYLNAPNAGDGRVTLESAMLPGVPTWQLDCEHGSLPDKRSAFEAYLELLVDGSTRRLAVQAPATAARGIERGALLRSRPSRERQRASLPASASGSGVVQVPDSAAAAGSRFAASAPQPLSVSVINGDLKFVRHPLMLGHYTSSRVTGTEGVVNGLIGGTMAESLSVQQYPDAPGSHQFFANTGCCNSNPLQLPRPECVVVVGLGAEGSLRPADLSYTVKMGALALAQRLFEQGGADSAHCEIAATLIGSGGAGIGTGQAAQAIVQGMRDADCALAELNQQIDARSHATRGAAPARQWPRISRVWLIELYLDRASEAWRALSALASASPERYALSERIEIGIGAMRRPLDGGYRGTGNDYLRAAAVKLPAGDVVLEYTVDTKKRARTERLVQPVQERLLRNLVKQASGNAQRDAHFGRTLFNLLVPLELEPFLGGTTEMLLQVDRATAGIPWELLDTDVDARLSSRAGADTPRTGDAATPWAIRAKLIRTLTTLDYRRSVVDARPEAHLLVIGEPLVNDERYPPLPGARAEAHAVHDLLLERRAELPGQVVGLIGEGEQPGPDALTVINTLMSRDWRIVHIAGHGEAPDDQDERDAWGAEASAAAEGGHARATNARGVVLSDGTFLGPCEIRSMRVVPELVFVNCCHLAGRSAAQTLDVASNFDRARYASGVAEALIDIGVRCVVAAGWAVDDVPAQVFATRFYGALMRGARFIDAVAEAREAAHLEGGNTWAAYQCYGDPNWRYTEGSGDAQRPAVPLGDEYAGVMSAPALALALETLAIECEHQGRDPAQQRARIRHLEAQFATQWGGMGAVAEAFGVACRAAGDTEAAIGWLARAVAANDGSATLKASEQWGHLRVKRAWQRVDQAADAMRVREKSAASGPRSAGTQAARHKAQAALDAAIEAARPELADALTLLNRLIEVQPTMERHSLCGSAYKRLAMIERLASRPAQAQAALRQMQHRYAEAERLGCEAGLPDWYYPAMNRLAGVVALGAGPTRAGDAAEQASVAPQRWAAVRQALIAKTRDDPDFFSVVGLTELRLLEAVANGALAAACAGIVAEFDALNVRMPGTPKWRSVLEQLDFVLADLLQHGSRAECDAARTLTAHVEAYLARAG